MSVNPFFRWISYWDERKVRYNGRRWGKNQNTGILVSGKGKLFMQELINSILSLCQKCFEDRATYRQSDWLIETFSVAKEYKMKTDKTSIAIICQSYCNG